MKYFCLGVFASVLLYLGGVFDGACAALAPTHILRWIGMAMIVIGALLVTHISLIADKKVK